MQISQKNIDFVEKYAKIYCKRLDLDYDDIIFIFEIKDFIWFATVHAGYKNPSLIKYFGQTFQPCNVIYICLYKHDNLDDLKDTIAHELIHLRYKGLNHGRKFTMLIQDVLGGKKLKDSRK